ncbi:MAG: hypothetical protein AABY07_02960 [Nanoarchaeota archaeon]
MAWITSSVWCQESSSAPKVKFCLSFGRYYGHIFTFQALLDTGSPDNVLPGELGLDDIKKVDIYGQQETYRQIYLRDDKACEHEIFLPIRRFTEYQ